MYLPSVSPVSSRAEVQTSHRPATPSLVSRQRNVDPGLLLSKVNVGVALLVSDLGLEVIVVSGGESSLGSHALPVPSASSSAWSGLASDGQLSAMSGVPSPSLSYA